MKITNFPKPNYKAWDQINIFDHFQATCLWADFEPSIKASRQEICYALHKLFEEAREEGFLRSDVVKKWINGRLEYNVIFHRKDLIAYAEWKDVKPAFLYPETRTDADASIRTDSSSPPNPAALPSKAKVEDLSESAVELPKEEVVQKEQSQSSENEQPVISEHEYQKEFCDLFDPLHKAKVEDLPNTAAEPSKIEDVQKIQIESNENEQPVISEHEYPKETYDLLDPLSKAKAEDLPDTAVELPKKEDAQKTQSQSSENEQPVISENEYPKEICDLFGSCSIPALKEIFPELKDELIKAINRSSRNGLDKARARRGQYYPTKIASWLIRNGIISQQKADTLLRKALPPCSKHSSIADDYFRGNEMG